MTASSVPSLQPERPGLRAELPFRPPAARMPHRYPQASSRTERSTTSTGNRANEPHLGEMEVAEPIAAELMRSSHPPQKLGGKFSLRRLKNRGGEGISATTSDDLTAAQQSANDTSKIRSETSLRRVRSMARLFRRGRSDNAS